MDIQMEYPISDLARIFPDMPPEDFARLVASIREDGLMDPITVWQGQVIDGRHRYAACSEAGVERRFEYLDDDADPLRHILARNDLRRHLDESRRAVVAHKLSASSAPGRPRKENDANLHSSFTQGEAAELLRVSRRTVAHAARVLSEDSPAAPAVRLAVEQGRATVSDASRVIDEPAEVRPHLERRRRRRLQSGCQRFQRLSSRLTSCSSSSMRSSALVRARYSMSRSASAHSARCSIAANSSPPGGSGILNGRVPSSSILWGQSAAVMSHVQHSSGLGTRARGCPAARGCACRCRFSMNSRSSESDGMSTSSCQ